MLGLKPRKVAERGRGGRRGDSYTPASTTDKNRNLTNEEDGAGDSLLIRVKRHIADSRRHAQSIGYSKNLRKETRKIICPY